MNKESLTLKYTKCPECGSFADIDRDDYEEMSTSCPSCGCHFYIGSSEGDGKFFSVEIPISYILTLNLLKEDKSWSELNPLEPDFIGDFR